MVEKILGQINSENAQSICTKIQEDADSETKVIIERAKVQADEISKNSEKMFNNKKQFLMAELEKDLQKSQEKISSTLNLEKKRILLEARSKFVDSVFAVVKQKALDFRKDAKYSEFIFASIIEGAQIIETGDIEIFYSYIDEAIFTNEFLNRLKTKITAVVGKSCTISLNKNEFKDLGVIINSKDGRLVYDNRFLSRLGRNYDQFYIELLKEAQ